jgi:peptidoglycan hydrolase-like protein with peptidoglycan-binding domain
MTSLKYPDFKGPAKPVEDLDLPRIGAAIGVGEDEVHMLVDVEAAGAGFDAQGRPKMLFEPHIFWRELGAGKERDAAVKQGLAYPKWKRNYPKDSYPRLVQAMKIDEAAALRSASWGATQILGDNFKLAGFGSVHEMVDAMCEDEDNHIEAMIEFVKAAGIDDDLRRLAGLKRPTTPADCAPIARAYNGPGYAENRYHIKMAEAHNKWRKIPDTPLPDGPIITPPAPAEVTFTAAQVREFQQLLKDKGYVEVGKADGDIGKATVSAIAAFEIAQGRPVTGKMTQEVWDALKAAPMRPVSEERANATVPDLVNEDVPAVKPASWLKKIGIALGTLTGLGSIVDGGVPDLDKLTSSINKTQVIIGLIGDKLPWLIGLAAAGAAIYYGHTILSRQLEGFRKGTIR